MPVVESCAKCGLPLMWIENESPARGDYFHLFTLENAHLYKGIHRPVPCLKDYIPTDDFGLYRSTSAQDETFNSRVKVEPRASIAPDAAPAYPRATEKRDVAMAVHFLKAIFAAR